MFPTHKFAAGCWLAFSLLTACSLDWTDGVEEDAATAEAIGDAGDGSVSQADTGHVPPHAGTDAGTPSDPGDAQTTSMVTTQADATAGQGDAAIAPNETGPVTMDPPVIAPVMPTMAELCKVCDAHATCAVSGGQASCSCGSGYVGDGNTCQPGTYAPILGNQDNPFIIEEGAFYGQAAKQGKWAVIALSSGENQMGRFLEPKVLFGRTMYGFVSEYACGVAGSPCCPATANDAPYTQCPGTTGAAPVSCNLLSGQCQ